MLKGSSDRLTDLGVGGTDRLGDAVSRVDAGALLAVGEEVGQALRQLPYQVGRLANQLPGPQLVLAVMRREVEAVQLPVLWATTGPSTIIY